MPPRYSATVNCQPSRTHKTSPSSQTRLVEANWKASADAAEAPFENSDLAIAIAAYEHEDDAAPRPLAHAIGFGPSPAIALWMRSCGTQACTTAEMANPSTSAHHTSQAIRNESFKPFQITSSTTIRPRLSVDRLDRSKYP